MPQHILVPLYQCQAISLVVMCYLVRWYLLWVRQQYFLELLCLQVEPQVLATSFPVCANLGVFFGSGAPTLSAAQGSLYLRTDGSSTSTRMYVNTNGTTTWTAVTTAA